ncbi:MAG: hypothetical protein ACI4QJ_04015 [Candidatus Spyradenecus sp.]
MNGWKQTLQLTIGLTVATWVGLAYAAEVKLSETEALQETGDLSYTFTDGDTFVVDAPFSPNSFAPTCPGAFTMKVVSGGSVADTTALNFSGVTGVLTLSGLGTTEARLPAPTFASGKTVNLESCWFSTLALTTTSATNMAYNVSGTGALGSLTAVDDIKYATLNLSGTQEITTIVSPYKSGKELLTVKVNEGASVTVTGDYDAGCSNLTVNGVMTCKGNFETNRKDYQNTSITVPAGGKLVVEKDFLHGQDFVDGKGHNANPYLYIEGGEVKVAGTFIRNCAGQSKGTVSIASGLLQVGALQDKNTTNSLPFGNTQAGTATCLLTGGTLEVLGGKWTSTAATFHTKGTTVKVGEDISMGIAWVLEADTPLIVAEGKTINFANTITSDGVALDLADNLGTVSLGSNRPQLKAVGGSIKVSPTADELVAGQIALPVKETVTSIEETTWQVVGWEAVTATLDSNAHQVILSQAGSMPTRVLSGDGVWNEAGWEGCETAPTSGSAEVTTEVNATLTIDTDVALDALYFDVGAGKTLTVVIAAQNASLAVAQTIVKSGTVIVQGGSYGQVSLASGAALLFGQGATFTSVDEGGTIGLSGSGSWDATAAKTLLFRAGTFRKAGEGKATLSLNSQSGNVGEQIEVTGGTLELSQYEHADRTYTGNISVAAGATFAHAVTWASAITVTGYLSGEGAVSIGNNWSGNSTRTATFSGDCASFTGAIEVLGSHCTLTPKNKVFGGSVSLKPAGAKDPPILFTLGDGLEIQGDLKIVASTTSTKLALQGATVKAKTLALGQTVALVLPEASIVDDTVLFTLTGAQASAETAALMTVSAEGYFVVADGANYVLRKVTLPGVNPSAPDAGDEQAYSTEAEEKLTAAAEKVRLAEVSEVLLQTKGAATASVPTVTEVNNVLGCFDGVVKADAEAKTLTIRYEFGVADIAADDSETPWNGKWQVVAKVEGPEGGSAAFVEGVTVAAYEVGEDGEIPADATPLSSTTVEAGTPVNAVTLTGIKLDGLGTHGVRVRVKATNLAEK